MELKVVVLTLVGSDRPGLVEALSECVARHGGNWEVSRMAHLGGQFAGLLRVTVPVSTLAALERALRGLDSHGLSVATRSEEKPTMPLPGQRLRLEVTAHDREGIVRDVARILAAQGLNVEELATHCESAAMSGESLFRAEALLRAPTMSSGAATDLVVDLRNQLEAIGDDLMVDISEAAEGAGLSQGRGPSPAAPNLP